jgi:dGTPase
MELERKGKGWNLSLQVLDGILAHNGEMLHREYVPQYGKSWEQFEDEYAHCMQDAAYSKKILPMTLEGCVVRISDVIAYIGRDIEDAITIGLIGRQDIPEAVVSVLGSANRNIINNLVMDLIENSYGKDHLEFSPRVFDALSALLEFNYQEIYHNPKIKTEGQKIDHMFEHLFEAYADDLRKQNENSVIFSDFLSGMGKSYLQSTQDARIAVDFIAGMTDDFFNNQYRDRFVPTNMGYGLHDIKH